MHFRRKSPNTGRGAMHFGTQANSGLAPYAKMQTFSVHHACNKTRTDDKGVQEKMKNN